MEQIEVIFQETLNFSLVVLDQVECSSLPTKFIYSIDFIEFHSHSSFLLCSTFLINALLHPTLSCLILLHFVYSLTLVLMHEQFLPCYRGQDLFIRNHPLVPLLSVFAQPLQLTQIHYFYVPILLCMEIIEK